jgi:hypothetical protein
MRKGDFRVYVQDILEAIQRDSSNEARILFSNNFVFAFLEV